MKLHIEEKNLEKKSNIYIVHENGLKVGRINNISDAETIVKRVNEYEELENRHGNQMFNIEQQTEKIKELQVLNRELTETIEKMYEMAAYKTTDDVKKVYMRYYNKDNKPHLKFKVGDRVKIIDAMNPAYIGKIGIIEAISRSSPFSCKLEIDGKKGSWTDAWLFSMIEKCEGVE